jgi:thiamine-monophosphate kinase
MPRRRTTENSILAKIAGGSPSNQSGKRLRGSFAHGKRLSLGIGDDAALFRSSRGCETILTCDWFLEGTHFLRRKHPPDSVGWKCLARAVSDIAAMGGAPRCFLLSLAIPENATGEWLDKFLRGLRRAAQHFDCALAGGDTTRRKEILINVTVIGEIAPGRALRRDGANPGDLLYVSSRLGEAERGLRLLQPSNRAAERVLRTNNAQLRRHLYPEPRLALGQWLVKNRIATSAMDISDGLSSDLPRLCAASGVGARVDAAKLPVVTIPSAACSPRHVSGRKALASDVLSLALHGGDDYELLFTAPKSKELQIPPAFAGVAITSIGEITANRKIFLVGTQTQPTLLESRGWDPFR